MRFVRSVFVPEDETCFYIYEATSVDDVREATRLAGLPSPHIAEMVKDERLGRATRINEREERPK